MTSESCKTLIVEDDPFSARALRLVLERHGHDVQCASTLREAQQKLEWRPEFLLLDLILPDGNGMELLRRIRDEHRPVNVVIMTGVNEPAMLDQVNELKPAKVFHKPLDFAGMLQTLGSTHPGAPLA